jgi:hypothetical protein
MKKMYLILAVVVLLLLVPRAGAWSWSIHWAVAEAAYNELPENVRIRFNYTLLVNGGAVWPDQYRNDQEPWAELFRAVGIYKLHLEHRLNIGC